MKAIIEIITRVRALSLRLAAFLLAATAATGAWAATPVADVVWESDFSSSKTGTDGNTYSITLNGNTVNSDGNLVINNSANSYKGASISLTDTKTAATVLIKYSSLAAYSTANATLANIASSSYGLGARSSSAGQLGLVGFYNEASSTYNFSTQPSLVTGSGYFLLGYSYNTGTMAYAGSSLSSMTGGNTTSLRWSDFPIATISVGGGIATSKAYAWNGVVIEKVAIFFGAYSATDLADYEFPGDAAMKSAVGWALDAGYDVAAWRENSATTFHTSKTGAVDSDGSVSPATALTYGNYGRAAGTIGPVLCYDKAGYVASSDAQFYPFSVGGLYVNALGANDATYTVTGSGTRHSYLGCTGKDTYFTFNQPFAFNRSGNVTIYGNATVTTGSGVTFNCNSSQSSYTTILNSGATLKLAGEGNMAVTTLNASNGTLDFSALSSRSAALPYITGTVQLGANTSIIVPEGTTPPYKIGTAVSGTTYPGSITIGSKTYATTLSAGDNDGEIAWTINSATIDTAGTYTLEDLFASTSTTGSYEIDVEESATLDVASAATIANLTLNVTDGKTLTITGSDLTISGEIILNGGTVAVSSATALSGTVGGDGQFIYTAIPEGMTWTGSGWTGTLTLQDLTFENKLFSTYGNTGSTLELVGVQGYNNEMVYSSQTWVNPTVKFTDSETSGREFGFKYTSANAGSYFTFNKIAGAGKLVCVDSSTQTMRASIFTDFSGSIDIGTHAFIFGTSSNTGDSGTITVPSGVTLAVAAGETWKAEGGLVVNGTLTVDDGATVSSAITGSGTVVANNVVPTTGSGFTGTLTISGDGTSGTYCSETEIYGSRLNVAEGYVILTGDITTLPDSIDIQSGATLYFYQCPATSLSLKMGTWNGMLYFYNCTALTTLTLDAGAKRSFSMTDDLTLPAGTLTTVNLVLDEVKGEGGTITLSNTAAISAIAGRTYNFTVNRLDGETVTGTYDSSTGVVSYVPSISGSATDLDWDFTDGENDAFEQAPSGMGKNHDDSDNTPLSFYTDADDSTQTGVYIKHHPYTTGAASWFTENSAAMTVVVVGTMPSTQNTIFLNFGSAYVNKYGLLIATTANENEVLIGYNYGGTVTPITTMTVPNASSSRHSYIVTKVDGATATTFTVYLDGTKWKTVTTDAATLGTASDVKVAFTGNENNGIQVGSDYGGNIYKAGTYSSVNASTGDGVLNVLRAYGRIITQAEIDAYAAAFPYDSPSGKSTRTFTAASENWIDETENSAVWSNTKSGNTSGTPDIGAQLEVTASAASAQTIEVNLAAQASYESLLVEGSQIVTFELADGYTGAIAPGKTTIKTPVIVKPGVLNLSGGPTFVEGDGHLTFDYSGYTMSGTSAIELTGEMDRNDSAVTITPPADQHYTYTYGYSGTQYVITPAVAVAVLNHNGTLTSYASIADAVAAAQSGDTVTLQTTALTPSTLIYTATGEDKSGVTFVIHGVEVSAVYADSNTTWTTDGYYHWTGEGADTNWTTPANWGLASGYPNANTMAVLFDKASTVVFNSNSDLTVASVTVNAAVTLTGNGTRYLRAPTFDGSGTLTLGADVCLGSADATTMSVALVVAGSGDDKVKFKLYSGVQWKITSTITGTGDLYCDGTSSTYTTFNFVGNTQDFEGTVTCSAGGSNRSTSYISSGVAAGAKSAWEFHLSTDSGSSGRSMINPGDNGLAENYYFGALNGYVRLDTEAVNSAFRVVIGGRAEDSVISGSLYRNASYNADNRPIIRKVGASRLTLNTDPSKLEIVDGKVELASGVKTSLKFVDDSDAATVPVLTLPEGSSVDPAAKIIGSDAPIAFDSEGNSYTWNGQIPNSNTGGFIKKGAGTLTLTTLPLYTGATAVEAGTLVLPAGTVFSGAVTIAEGAKIQFEADPNWADGATPTICTFTTAPSADTLSRIEITGFGGRQSATLNYDSGTGEYVATVTSPTLVWNGADGANWGDEGVWLVDGAAATFMSGDKVSFPDSLFTGETTELTVNVGADVDPSLVTIAPGTGHTYKFTGTGKVTTENIVVAKSGEGSMILDADVFSGKSISNTGSGAITFNADVELAALTATVVPSENNAHQNVSGVYATIAAGKTLTLTDEQTITHPLNILGDLSLTGSGTYYFGAKYKGSGNVTVESGAKLQLRHYTSGGTTILTYSDGYTGDFTVDSGAVIEFYQRNQTHNSPFYTSGGTIKLNGGTVTTVSGSVNTVYLGNIEAVDGSESSIQSGDTRYQMYISGAVTGSGTINITTPKVGITGATSAFTGTLNWTNTAAGDNNSLSNASTSADATYNVTGAPASATQLMGLNFSGTAEMGAFNVSSANARVGVNNANVELEIGAKANSTLNGQFITNPLTITKVGDTTLTLGSGFSMVSDSTLNVDAGSLSTGALTYSGLNLAIGEDASYTATGDVVLDGTTLDVDGFATFGTASAPAWLKAQNNAVINLNAGGELAICRITAYGNYTVNFDGGTLTEYDGNGAGKENIIGGRNTEWEQEDNYTITLNVRAGGLTVDTATDTTITPVLAGDAESVGGGLTKKGAGTLTLAAAPTFTGAITVEGGSVVVPLTAEVTLGGETYVSASTATTKTLSKHGAYSANVDANKADVPYSWVKSNVDGFDGMTEEQIVAALAADSATPQANGYNYFTCYALGLNPADADDKPLVSVSVDADGNFVVTLTDKDGNVLDTASNVTVTPSFYKYNPSTGTYSASPISSTIAPADVVGEDNVGYIRAKIDVSAE